MFVTEITPAGASVLLVTLGTSNFKRPLHELQARASCGKYVIVNSILKDGRTIQYIYAHMASISVKNGSTVKKGDVLGIGGQTGNASNVDIPHCHIQIKISGSGSDPNGYMKTKFDSNGNPQ